MSRHNLTCWHSADQKRRVTVYCDAKGRFFFEEEALDFYDDDAEYGITNIWTCVNQSGLYATLKTAEEGAIAETRWLRSLLGDQA